LVGMRGANWLGKRRVACGRLVGSPGQLTQSPNPRDGPMSPSPRVMNNMYRCYSPPRVVDQ
jgi:hypothetical protein